MKPDSNGLGTVGHGSVIQRLRLVSGLILFFYVVLHFINHALGHYSLEAMEVTLIWFGWFWYTWPGTIILYGALTVHATLGVWKIAQIKTFKRPLWEWIQIGFAILIPVFLASHIIFTRYAEYSIGIEVDYRHELDLLYPGAMWQQNLLMVFVWVHACSGIHFWLRIRTWYASWFPTLAALAVAIPSLSMTGWLAAARRLDQQATQAMSDPNFAEQVEENRDFMGYIIQTLKEVEGQVNEWLLMLAIVVIVFMIARYIADRFKSRVSVTYGDGTKTAAAPGTTILDVSRNAGISHMSVCGGRARCSTCRTLVTDGLSNLSEPADAEAVLLSRLNAGPGIRLACQARINGDVSVRPLIQSRAIYSPSTVDPLGWGVEREIAVLFLDIRGFSRISEKSLPYDVVFILNSLFGEVSAEIEAANGYVDKFMGDGLMALFGLGRTPEEASRDALLAACRAQDASANASRMLTQHLEQPIRIGVGVHTGQAIIGRIGRTSDQSTPTRLTAIGDTVNVAARLESATKELQAGIVISAATIERAGIDPSSLPGERSEINVHNISKPIDVLAINDYAGTLAQITHSTELVSTTKKKTA